MSFPVRSVIFIIILCLFNWEGTSLVLAEQFHQPASGQIIGSITGENLPGINILVKGTTKGKDKKNKGEVEVAVLAAEVTITGTVVDQNGEPIPGATVSIPGTGIGTATDLEGQYSITVPEGSTLVFSFIGFFDANYCCWRSKHHRCDLK